MAFTTTDATFLGIILEGICYGALAALFVIYMFIQQERRKMRGIPGAPLVPAITLLFILCTLYAAIDISKTYFELLSDTVPPSPLEQTNLDLATSAIFSIVDFLAQAILIYRCWVVWEKNLLVVFVPGFLALAALGGDFALVGLLGTAGLDGAGSILGRFLPTGITAFSFSLGVNALTSCLILNRMWVAQKRTPARSIPLIASITLESGIIIVFTQLIWVVLFAIQHPAFSLVGGPIIQIYGITPTLLIIRTTLVVVYENSNEFELGSVTRVAASTTQAEDMRHGLDRVSEKSV